MALRIFFVMRTAAHFPYHSTTVDHLVKRGHAVTLLFDPTWNKRGPINDRAMQEWLAGGRNVEIRDAIQRRGFWRKILFVTREARSYAHYCRRGNEFEFYRKRWNNYLPAWLRKFTGTRVGSWVFRQRVTQRLLTGVERLVPADAAIMASLRREKPDCVIASPIDMRFDEEVEYIKAARAAGIPSMVPVLSWDNLTTKGLFHAQPDLVLAWHKGHQKEAQAVHGVPRERIVVTGSPFFDKWFDGSTTISSRTATCQRINLAAEKPYLLYLGSSVNIAADESWLVIQLATALRASGNPALRRLQVIFKPHPANLRPLPKLDKAKVSVWPRDHGLPDTAETVGHFRDMLHHAMCVAGLNTTGMVDAILCDRPCMALTVKEYKTTQTDTVHFQRMEQSKALYIADSVKQAVKLLGKLQAGQEVRAKARRSFMKTYARPRGLGADAGEAAALAIEHGTRRLKASEITAAIDRELAGRPVPGAPAVEPEPRPTASRAIRRSIEKARRSPIFRHYEHVRDLVLMMMDEESDYGCSAYWKEEINGFHYMFDASPMVIAKLREHTYHITGLKSYEYRDHHEAGARPFASKLSKLKKLDPSNLFVPEARQLGGFGHRIRGGLVNLDTLKFYECLIALDRGGVIDEMRAQGRRRILEIGAGWGGFAYQLKTLFPNTTYLIVDLAPTLLFSATYLKATFPDARMRFYGELSEDELFADLDQTDFIFLPAHAFAGVPIPAVDMALNIASFQEMTTEQVAGYVEKLADSGCRQLYSLNRDRSPYNNELTTVTEIMETRYRVERLEILEVPYTVLTWKEGKAAGLSTMDYRHQIGRS